LPTNYGLYLLMFTLVITTIIIIFRIKKAIHGTKVNVNKRNPDLREVHNLSQEMKITIDFDDETHATLAKNYTFSGVHLP
jgi:hypothetical protein